MDKALTVQTTKAVEVRRQLLEHPQVYGALTPIERDIFIASTKVQIAELPAVELAEKAGQLFRYIAIDVGYNIPANGNDWAYMQTRLIDILRRYYSQLTLADIKLAFELAVTGKLDAYLPRDAQGNPDKKHYQQFNADYFGKILNAYTRRLNDVFHKVYSAAPEPKPIVTPEMMQAQRRERSIKNRITYLRYKYTGILNFGFVDIGVMFVFDWLLRVGLIEPLKIEPADRNKAFAQYMGRAATGLVNKYTAHQVRKEGASSAAIDAMACDVARKKAIRRAFDEMIANEINIDHYV